MEAAMKLVVKFTKGDETLTQFEKVLEKPEDFREANDEAFDKFEEENPGTLLMDGVVIHYDKAD
jgi:hypothetical protein